MAYSVGDTVVVLVVVDPRPRLLAAGEPLAEGGRLLGGAAGVVVAVGDGDEGFGRRGRVRRPPLSGGCELAGP